MNICPQASPCDDFLYYESKHLMIESLQKGSLVAIKVHKHNRKYKIFIPQSAAILCSIVRI